MRKMNLESNQAIKVLEVDPKDGSLRSCHGGTFTWDHPVLNEDGSWTPGAWTPPVNPVLCRRGYHLTDNPIEWWDHSDIRAYLVEFRGRVDGSFEYSLDSKISVESCRLLRPLTSEELGGYRIFIEGEHVVEGNIFVRVSGNAIVTARGLCSLKGFDKAKIFAHDKCVVHGCDNTEVHSFDSVRAHVYNHATLYARDNSLVDATDGSTVYAYDNSDVSAAGHAKIHCMDSNIRVVAYGSASIFHNGNLAVERMPGFTGVINCCKNP